ncbi:rhodanese-like domain-containing protein [Geovibrio thiophilus]|uniref:Rhodanese-like domain-containing protein n=1 Tax=Geovibrio thiophilus TaxID=139438 RepID=A0A3R5UZK3_9BACT|nr:rhodanese-like domain-containing protein [Geovibrio thiophilus]QAR34314.1 rhodanese-like domain-containing protein [Geovibrio thiophilus]
MACEPGQVLNADGSGGGRSSSGVSAENFMKLQPDSIQVIDIRTKTDFAKDGLKGAVNIFLHDIVNEADKIDKSRPVYVYCANGSKGSIAVMVLRDLGFEVYNIDGGLNAFKEAGII